MRYYVLEYNKYCKKRKGWLLILDKKATIITYGCQMNESDSEHFAGQLADLGYRYAEDFHDADVVLINTCCVRESAEKKILGKIGELNFFANVAGPIGVDAIFPKNI